MTIFCETSSTMWRKKILTLLVLCVLVPCQSRQPDYPGPTNYSRNEPGGRYSGGLSLKFARILDSINDPEEILSMIEGVPTSQSDFFITSRFGGEERSNAIRPTPARCMPEMQVVSFTTEHTDPSIVYIPNCTRIKQCGGCCSHPLLSCQPTASVTKNFEVTVTKVNSEGGLTYRDKEIIPLEEHTKCQCNCRIKAEHCTAKQVYNEEDCMCECTNVDDAEKCRLQNATKLWDPNACACLCRSEVMCSTGLYFDPVSCRCEQLAISRWFGSEGTTDYRLRENTKSRDTSPLIVPFDNNNRRRKNKDDPEYK